MLTGTQPGAPGPEEAANTAAPPAVPALLVSTSAPSQLPASVSFAPATVQPARPALAVVVIPVSTPAANTAPPPPPPPCARWIVRCAVAPSPPDTFTAMV